MLALLASFAASWARAPPTLGLGIGRRSAVLRAAIAPLEFSRPHRVERGKKYQRVTIEATPAECQALCDRFELDGLGALQANVSLSAVGRQQKMRVRASGSLSGIDIRRKSYSGESVTVSARGVEFEAFFASEPEGDGETRGEPSSRELDLSDDDAFDEPMVDGSIDLGELVAQHFYMHLNDLSLLEAGEWAGEDLPGTVYYDTNPGDSDGGGTIGERLGW